MISLEKSIEFIKDDEKLNKKVLNVKLGMDPTSPNLHLGHFVLLKQAKNLQEQGHKIILIVGDFTASIGDPSGRNKLRPKLSREDIAENAKTYLAQVLMVLDKEKTEMRFNSDWLNKIELSHFFEILSNNTLQQIIVRDDFNKRMENNTPIHMHELMYPLLQGYDSVEIEADIELGGTDQLFNLNMGRDMQKHFGDKPQMIATFPLLIGLDGENKMSKSLKNDVGFLDSPEDKFGKVMSISDKTMENWIETLDVFTKEEKQVIAKLNHPLDKKKKLSNKIVEEFHGLEIANKVEQAFIQQFSKKSTKEIEESLDLIEYKVESGTNLNKFIKDIGFAKSNQDGLRKVSQGAVKINNNKETNNILLESYFSENKTFLIQVGKRQFAKVNFDLSLVKKNKKRKAP